MMAAAAAAASVQREVIKSNWLQHKVRKKCGTLIRKKKILYEEAEWVVFCVHDDRIPLLEWYFSEECSHDHRPSKVVDLLDLAFFTPVISDSRSFIIGFTQSSRDPIELAALTPEDCADWIQRSTTALKRLRCLNDTTNVYSVLSDPVPIIYPTSVDEPLPLNFSLDDEVPQTIAPMLGNLDGATVGTSDSSNNCASQYDRVVETIDFSHLVLNMDSDAQHNSSAESLENALDSEAIKQCRRKASFHQSDVPPPLPPRHKVSTPTYSSPVASPRAGSVYDFPKNCISPPKGAYGTLEHQRYSTTQMPSSKPPSYNPSQDRSHEPWVLSKEIAAPSVEVKSSPKFKKLGYSIPSSIVISPQSRRSSESTTNIHTNGRTSSQSYDTPSVSSPVGGPVPQLWLNSPVLPLEEKQSGSVLPSETGVETLPKVASVSPNMRNSLERDAYDAPLGTQLKHIALQLSLCVESIAFVEVNQRIWIAGWNVSCDKRLTGVLRIGDELVQVGGIRVGELSVLPGIFYSSSIPGTPVNLTIRQIPYGTEYTFIKTSHVYDLGVVLRKHKNKLERVKEDSPAYKAGLRAIVAGTNGTLTAACITHFNGEPLNLFSRNDELLHRIDSMPTMCKFTLIVQPYNFVKELKRAIKKLKNYGTFMRND